MNNILVIGALILLALVAFKLFGKLLKIAVLIVIAAIAAIYFFGGQQIGGFTIPSVKF